MLFSSTDHATSLLQSFDKYGKQELMCQSKIKCAIVSYMMINNDE